MFQQTGTTVYTAKKRLEFLLSVNWVIYAGTTDENVHIRFWDVMKALFSLTFAFYEKKELQRQHPRRIDFDLLYTDSRFV